MSELGDKPFTAVPADAGAAIGNASLRAAHDAGFAPGIVHSARDTWTQLVLLAADLGMTLIVDLAVANDDQAETRLAQ